VKRLLIGVPALCLLAACGGSKTTANPPAAPGTTAAAVVASSSATAWTTQEAGQQYLAMIAEPNKDITALRALPDTATAAQYTAIAKQLTTDLATFATALNAGKWPSQVQAKVDADETSVLAERSIFQSISQATSTADINSILSANQATLTTATANSEALRIALGLASN